MCVTEKEIFRYLWESVKPYKTQILIILQAPMVASCFVPITQYATKITLDRLVENEIFVFSDLLLPLFLFICGQLAAELSWGVSNWVNYRSMVFVKANITSRAYAYVIEHSYNFFQDNYSGTISAKIENLQTISNKIFDNIKLNIINRLTILTSTCVLFYLVAKIFVVAVLIFYAVFFPVVYYLSKKLYILSEDYTHKKQKTSGLIVDSITNIFSVLLFSSKQREKHSIEQGLNTILRSEQRMLRYEFLLQLFIGFTYLSISIGVLFALIYLRRKGSITIGDFALVLGALFHMLEVSYSLVTNVTELIKDWGELKESFSLFSNAQQIQEKSSAKKLVIKKPSIYYEDVHFMYVKDRPILSGLTLMIKAWEKVGLVGHSGAGKSTLINLLLRYFQTNSGRILLDSQDIRDVTETSLRLNISVVPQDTMLFHRSIGENIAYSKEATSEKEVIEASKKAGIYDFITSLPEGFETIVGERGIKLSGGQKQKVAIARAFLKNAPILVLDEATSNLDSQSEQEIQQSLASLIQDKTVIAIAHRLSTLRNMDRILLLEQGKVIDQGTHEQLLSNPRGTYRELWGLQNNGLTG